MKGFEPKKYIQLLLTGTSGVWIFLKSPLNPAYSDFQYHEMSFVYFYFFYWIIVSAFVLYIAFFINSSNFKDNVVKIFLPAVFLWYLYFIPYGFDVTDTGFTLSKQWAIMNGKWKENLDLIAGTNLIGGIWLILPGAPFLLWARFGFVIVQTLISFFTFRIAGIWFGSQKAFFFVLFFTITTSYSQYYHTINYDNLPYLFLLISVYFGLKVSNPGNSFKKNRIISGMAAVIAVFCKITYLPALFILPVLIYFLGRNGKEDGRSGRSTMFYIAGTAAGFALVVAVLLISGSLSSYVSSITEVIFGSLSETHAADKAFALRDHSLRTLLAQYLRTALFIMKNTPFTVLLILLASFRFKDIRYGKALGLCVNACFAFLFYFRIFEPEGRPEQLYAGMLIFAVSFFISSLISIWSADINKILCIAAAGVIFLLSYAGSDLDISTGFRSGAGVLLLSSVFLFADGASSLRFSLKRTSYAVMILFIIYSVVKDYRPYRDYKYPMLRSSFSSPQLTVIQTNEPRALETDGLLNYLKGIENITTKKLFVTKSNPLIYYITGTVYPYKTPWDTINDFDLLENSLNSDPPEIFVLSLYTHRDPYWPYADINWYSNDLYEQRAERYYAMYRQIINSNNYIEVYKNSFYTVYELKEGSGGDVRTEE
jgi:hypothetical protein